MNTFDIIFLVIVIGGLAVYVAINYSIHLGHCIAWEELAEQNSLNYHPGKFLANPTVRGVYHGHVMVLDTYTRGYQKSNTYTRIAFEVKNTNELWFSISNEGVDSKLKKIAGAKEILIGDEAIDSKYYIQGSPEVIIQRLLFATSIRQKLLDLKSIHIELNRREVVNEKRGVVTNPEGLLPVFDLLADLADAINRLEENYS